MPPTPAASSYMHVAIHEPRSVDNSRCRLAVTRHSPWSRVIEQFGRTLCGDFCIFRVLTRNRPLLREPKPAPFPGERAVAEVPEAPLGRKRRAA